MKYSNMMDMSKSKTIIFFTLLFSIKICFAQESGFISVDSEVDKSTITIGDLIEYKVIVKHAPEVQVFWPSLGSNLGAFEIRDYQVKDPYEADGLIFEEIQYTVSTFDTGAYIIPPIILEYALAGADSLRQQLQAEPLEIYVRSLLPSEEGDLRALKPQAEMPRNWRLLMLYIALGVGLLILIFGLIWYFRFRKKGEGLFSKPAPPPRPPHEIALEELARLEAEKLFENGKPKEYYSRLSDILRTYLGGVYHFDAMESTTYEIVSHLSENGQASSHLSTLDNVLDLCDLAKFAKYESTPEESVSAIKDIYAFVEATKPKEVVDVETGSENQNGAESAKDAEDEPEHAPRDAKPIVKEGVPAE
jgi:hypothetical protein